MNRTTIFSAVLTLSLASCVDLDDSVVDQEFREAFDDDGGYPNGGHDCSCPTCSCWSISGAYLSMSVHDSEGEDFFTQYPKFSARASLEDGRYISLLLNTKEMTHLGPYYRMETSILQATLFDLSGSESSIAAESLSAEDLGSLLGSDFLVLRPAEVSGLSPVLVITRAEPNNGDSYM